VTSASELSDIFRQEGRVASDDHERARQCLKEACFCTSNIMMGRGETASNLFNILNVSLQAVPVLQHFL